MAETRERVVICLSGLAGTGKTKMAELLAERFGFAVFNTSQYIERLARKKGMTRESFETKIVLERKQEKVYAEMEKFLRSFGQTHKLIVIDEIHGSGDLTFVSRVFGRASIYLIDLRASKTLRTKRYLEREIRRKNAKELRIRDDDLRILNGYKNLQSKADIVIETEIPMEESFQKLKTEFERKKAERARTVRGIMTAVESRRRRLTENSKTKPRLVRPKG